MGFIGLAFAVLQTATLLNSVGPLFLGERAGNVFATLGRTPLAAYCEDDPCVYSGLYSDGKNVLKLSFVIGFPPPGPGIKGDIEKQNHFRLAGIEIFNLVNGMAYPLRKEILPIYTDRLNPSRVLRMTYISPSEILSSWRWYGGTVSSIPRHVKGFIASIDPNSHSGYQGIGYSPCAAPRRRSKYLLHIEYTFRKNALVTSFREYLSFPGIHVFF